MALGIEIEDCPFAKMTLQALRSRLTLCGKVRDLFEQSLCLAREAGYLKRRRGMRVSLDTTCILGRETVKGAYNPLADSIVKLMGALATVEACRCVPGPGPRLPALCGLQREWRGGH